LTIRWRKCPDSLPDVSEQIIGPKESLADATARVLADCGWNAEPYTA